MDTAVKLRDLLRDRHWQNYRSFCVQYDRAAREVDPSYVGTYPSRAQLHRWQAGGLKSLPYPHHCQVLEVMFPGFTAGELFTLVDGSAAVVPRQRSADADAELGSVLVECYSSRNAVPRALWDQLLDGARERVDVLVYVGMFLTENPALLPSLRAKGAAGAQVRLLLGDPLSRQVTRRSLDEGIGKNAITAKIKNALAFFRKIADEPGIEIRCHGTTLYNSIYRYDDQMIVNPHVFGAPAPHAPAMHLRRETATELFDTYADSFGRVWESATQPKW
ncbi:XRE family transcriptional regulator [Actinomycetospora endophytica]|uniref:XRE family transcriptional regulator n=1 Tax=Actinomycetospora endophytica TaxID=2291215 RepID=A0ABS8PHH4_9PSEU|nr:XRE family transcriptional regulator [Actinomycetospora endophytica]MCD2197682.1 XRE family transcriptional regulator [Actinomycetospora endophytica]